MSNWIMALAVFLCMALFVKAKNAAKVLLIIAILAIICIKVLPALALG